MRLTKNQLKLVRIISSNYGIKISEVTNGVVSADMINCLRRKGAISENDGRLFVCSATWSKFKLS
jgi:hypothetical protein